MALPDKISGGMTGHIAHHGELHTKVGGIDPPESGRGGHLTAHSALKAAYDAAHPSDPLPEVTDVYSHQIVHELLHAWQQSTPTTNTPWLPFEAPTRQVMVSSPQKIWGHYFVTYPLAGDGRANRSTWFTNNMPGGTQQQQLGGEYRDRPYDPFTRPRTETNPPWWERDKAQEIQWARMAGLSGFTIDWLNLNDGTGDNRTGQIRELANALMYLGVQNDFKLMLMPDGTTSICDQGNFNAFVAKTIDLLDDYPEVWHKDGQGRVVIFPYYPEGAPSTNPTGTRQLNTSASATLDYWTNYKAAVNANRVANGKPIIDLWFCYLRDWWQHATTAQALSSLGSLNSRWGDRDPTNSGGNNNSNRLAPTHSRTVYGKPWCHPVSNQDNRSNTRESPKYWEAWNTRNWCVTWDIAIDNNVEQVQIPTWSDIREHAHIMPSYNHGYCWIDLCLYFSARYVTGQWPQVVRDCIYLSHRIHRSAGYTVTGEQSSFMTRTGGTAAKDEIEALVFLTSTASTTVEINVNGTVSTFVPSAATQVAEAGPGVHRFIVALPTNGTISSRVLRNGVQVTQIDSPYLVDNTPVAQDMHYRMVSSLRGPI